jgi:hypothetical protein
MVFGFIALNLSVDFYPNMDSFKINYKLYCQQSILKNQFLSLLKFWCRISSKFIANNF